MIKEYALSVETDLFDNYLRVTKKKASAFMDGTLLMQDINAQEGIYAVYGQLMGYAGKAIQAYLFDKKRWSENDIMKWVTVSEKKNTPADIDYLKVIL